MRSDHVSSRLGPPATETGVRRGLAAARAVALRSAALIPILLVLTAVLWLAPPIWVLVTSLKLPANIVTVPPQWIPWPLTLEHYETALVPERTASIGRAFINSTIVGLVTAVLTVLVSALAAYPLAKMRFPGRNLIFAVLVGSLTVPTLVTIVPMYLLIQRLGWLSSYQALVVPETAAASAFGVFLLRQFFLSLPGDLLDAAKVDGASSWLVFWQILLPLSRPVLAVLSLFVFRTSWNDFLWPLIVINDREMMTLPVSLALLQGAFGAEGRGPILAGAVISALPLLIVFIVANRQIIESTRFTGLKG